MSKMQTELDGLTNEELFVKAMRALFITLSIAHEGIQPRLHIVIRKPRELAVLLKALVATHEVANSTYAQLLESRQRAADASKDSPMDSNIDTPNTAPFNNLGTKTPN
jgi:hypothetical protein